MGYEHMIDDLGRVLGYKKVPTEEGILEKKVRDCIMGLHTDAQFKGLLFNVTHKPDEDMVEVDIDCVDPYINAGFTISRQQLMENDNLKRFTKSRLEEILNCELY